MSWAKLSQEKRLELLKRKLSGEKVEDMAGEVGMRPSSLDRQLRYLNASMQGKRMQPDHCSQSELSLPKQKLLPENHELFEILKKGPISVRDLSIKLDRSEDTVLKLLEQMEASGYLLEKHLNVIDVPKMPVHKVRTSEPVVHDPGKRFTFGVASDTHVGSSHAQPTHLNHFIEMAYEEYDVRHILVPGDVTAGIFGYRGQQYDLIPCARALSRTEAYLATNAQVWLANAYFPQYPDLEYFVLGGNHDWWHVANAGIDAVSVLTQQRPDMRYMGYDVADVPLIDGVVARMHHPHGGGAYALSYKLQKNLEQIAFEELSRMVDDNLPPQVRFLLAGHLHTEVKFTRGPMVASQAGCFEGQTNYLKQRALYPAIGGQIWNVWLTRTGQIKRVEYTFVPYSEIPDDWQNWPVPPDSSVVGEPESVETIFSWDGFEEE